MNRNLALRLVAVVTVFFLYAAPQLAQAASPSAGDAVCKAIPASYQETCRTCFDGGGAWTAIGCISSDPSKLVGSILQFAIGIGGGLAFFLILFGGFQIFTSAGNPDGLNAGKELVGGAIAGLLFIIFSVFILRTIGATMIGIPGFK